MPIDPRKNFTLQKKCPIGSRNPICLALKNKEDAKEKKRKALENVVSLRTRGEEVTEDILKDLVDLYTLVLG